MTLTRGTCVNQVHAKPLRYRDLNHEDTNPKNKQRRSALCLAHDGAIVVAAGGGSGRHETRARARAGGGGAGIVVGRGASTDAYSRSSDVGGDDAASSTRANDVVRRGER